MVSKAISEGLLARIQNYVANDINSRIVMEGSDERYKVTPDGVYILTFSRVLNNWQATATAENSIAGYYELTHDGDSGVTIAKIYIQHLVSRAIL